MVKPNKYGHIDRAELLDPKVPPALTSSWLKDPELDFVKALRIKKLSTKPLVGRPLAPRYLSSKIEKALGRFLFSCNPVLKLVPVSNVFGEREVCGLSSLRRVAHPSKYQTTLMDWGNTIIRSFTNDAGGAIAPINADLNPASDFRAIDKKAP